MVGKGHPVFGGSNNLIWLHMVFDRGDNGITLGTFMDIVSGNLLHFAIENCH